MKVSFKITPDKINSSFELFTKLVNNLTGFSRLMSNDERTIKFDLRTKLMQQAVANLTSACNYLISKNQTEYATPIQARVHAISMLMVINALVFDHASTSSMLVGKECLRSSLITLMCRCKVKIIKIITQLIKISGQDLIPGKQVT